jgi:DNA repair ATPase RecN
MMQRSAAAYRTVVALSAATLALGCASVDNTRQAEPLAPGHAAFALPGITAFTSASTDRLSTSVSTDRKMVRSGDLAVSVDFPEEASPEVERLVKQAGGFVERSTTTKDSNVWLHCRVPAPQLDQIMDSVAALGEEERRSVSAADVTEQYADLETRLRNDLALRERLQELLNRASDVEDVLAIEKELNRIQSEIETMQARFDRLKSEVELSALSISLQRKQILGPLGYVSYAIWWAFSKLFVIQ